VTALLLLLLLHAAAPAAAVESAVAVHQVAPLSTASALLLVLCLLACITQTASIIISFHAQLYGDG
jgi:hypothetical protein